MDPGTLPDAAEIFKGYLDSVKDYISDRQYTSLKSFLDGFTEDLHVVHGDFQMKNVMLADNEPMLIDMDTLCVGDPVFDLCELYVTYVLFGEDEPDNSMNFLGISAEMSQRIWDGVVSYYFDGAGETGPVIQKIKKAAALRFLYIVTASDLKNSELGKIRIEHTRKHIDELFGL